MKVTRPGVFTANPQHGGFFSGWTFAMSPEEQALPADSEELTRMQYAAILSFLAWAAGVTIDEIFDPGTASEACLAIQKAASRDL